MRTIKTLDTASPIRSAEAQETAAPQFCEQCGAAIPPATRGRPSFIEVATNAICCIALLLVLVGAYLLLSSWSDDTIHHLFRSPLWHEPLDDWNI